MPKVRDVKFGGSSYVLLIELTQKTRTLSYVPYSGAIIPPITFQFILVLVYCMYSTVSYVTFWPQNFC